MAFNLFDIENDVDFEVIALSTVMPDYKFVYQLNKVVGVQLKRCEKDLDFIIKKKLVDFSTYEYSNEEDQRALYVIKNNTIHKIIEKKVTLFGEVTKEEKIPLLSELSSFNFIIKNQGYNSEEIIKKIKTIPNIQIVKKIDVSKIKSIHHLIF